MGFPVRIEQKTAENQGFLVVFLFTSPEPSLMIKYVQGPNSSEYGPGVLFDGERSAQRYGRIKGEIMATTRMTQTQLVRHLAEKVEVNNKVARALLDQLALAAIAEVKKNGVFVLPGIGRLVRVDRKARMGRNPATGQAIKIAAKKVVKFRVAKSAKDAIVPPKKAK